MQAMKWMMAASALAALAALAACGGGGDDAGDPPLPPGTIQISGAKQDGNTTNDDLDGRYAVTGEIVDSGCDLTGTKRIEFINTAETVLVDLCINETGSASVVYLIVKNNITNQGYACFPAAVDPTYLCPAGVTLDATNRTLSLQNVALKGETTFDANARVTVNGTISWTAPPP